MYERKVIFDRLAKLNLLAARDRVLLKGINQYTSLWFLQKIIDDYNLLLAQQEKLIKIVKNRQINGEMINIYEPIDSLNDYYSLELTVSDIKDSYLQEEVGFRESIELKSSKPLFLYPPDYSPLNLSLKALIKEAIAKNKELARLQEEYKLSKSDIILAAKRRGLSVDFFSYGGYGYSTAVEGSNSTGNSGHGFEWLVGIRAKYPIGKRKDIELEVKRKKLEAMKKALMVADKIKVLTVSITKLYNSIKKLKYKERIYESKLSLIKEKLNISYERYLKGEGTYKDYSDTLKSYISIIYQKYLNKSLLDASILQLYILTGRNLY